MKIVATICVRMGSSRFPGKVMKEINDKPLLYYLIERLKFSKRINEIVVATSTNKENDIIENYCKDNNLISFRGSEDDVLLRILEALKSRNADIGVEVFGDSPLLDFRIVDNLIDKFFMEYENLDFLSNDLKTTYPPGMEVEIFKVSALEDANLKANDPEVREHGTLFIRQNPELYQIKNIEAPEKFYFPDLELEVDTEEDFYVISQVIKHFGNRLDFSLEEILEFVKLNSDLFSMNKNILRRWSKYRLND